MQANFENPILAFTLTFEGGKADDPRDPGGRTNQGVTQRTYSAHRTAAGLGDADVFAMTARERTDIYRAGYWQAIGGADLPSGVDLVCFDFAVNSGPARARSALERAGGLAKAASQPVATVEAICAARLSFLHALGAFASFGRGWTARVAACEALGVKMALHARTGQPADAPTTRETSMALDDKARAAQRRSAVQVRTAQGAAAATLGSTGAASVLDAHRTTAIALAVLAAGAGLTLTLVLLWRAHRQTVKAKAYAAAAA